MKLGKNKTGGRRTTRIQSKVNALEEKSDFRTGNGDRGKHGRCNEHLNRSVKDKALGQAHDQAIMICMGGIRMQRVMKTLRHRQTNQAQPQAQHEKRDGDSSRDPDAI